MQINSSCRLRQNGSIPRESGDTLFRWVLLLGAAGLLFPIALTAVPRPQTVKSEQAENTDSGKSLFQSVGCAACHGDSAKGAVGPKITPPPLALPEFLKFVRQPSGAMAPFSPDQVSDAQLRNIYVFLQSLSPSADASITNLTGNAASGKRLFMRDGCYECHGILGQGANGYGPRIAPDPIPMQAIMNYIRKPTGNMPPYTAKIVPDQDLADIYAYLKSVPPPTDLKNIPVFGK